MFSDSFLSSADPLTLNCPALRDGKPCAGKAAIRTSPYTQSGLAKWVVSRPLDRIFVRAEFFVFAFILLLYCALVI